MDALVILGPTASGKSILGLQLAKELNGEILSVDSRQAYRHIDIGTAKPTPAERREVPHHLIDILELNERNNAQRFARTAHTVMDEVISRNKLPLLVGGSGLYFRTIFEGLFDIDIEQSHRSRFAAEVREIDTARLYRRLVDVDPESAGRIHPHDRYRVIRALEVYSLTGTPLSAHFRYQRQETRQRERIFVKIGLHLPREELYRRIDERAKAMLASGWIEEVETLLQEGADPKWPGLKTLGYPEVISFLRGTISREEMVETLSRQTRQYAKRQVTWFGKEPGVTWFPVDRHNAFPSVFRFVTERSEGFTSEG